MFSNGLGDHFIVLPAIRALAKLFEGRLTLITEELSHTEVIFQEVPFKKIHRTEHFNNSDFDAEKLAEELTTYDAVISINPWLANGRINRLLELLAPEVMAVGFYPCFPHCVPFNDHIHHADLAFSIPLYFDDTLKIEDFIYPPSLPQQVENIPGVFKAQIPEGCRILVVHTDTKEDKMWEKKHFVEVLNQLLEHHADLGIVVVGMELLDLSTCRFKERVMHFDNVPFEVSWGVVSCADYFLGIDSVFLHVADLYQIPLVALFKDDSHEKFGVRFARHAHVVSATGKMEDIEVDKVVSTINEVFFKDEVLIS